MVRDLDALLPLPAVPYDACDKQPSRVSSLSLVRYRTNDYSTPVAYGHREALVKGYVAEVVISCGAEVVARHPRSYERDDFVFDPIHYLPLLEQKTAALDPDLTPPGSQFSPFSSCRWYTIPPPQWYTFSPPLTPTRPLIPNCPQLYHQVAGNSPVFSHGWKFPPFVALGMAGKPGPSKGRNTRQPWTR